MRLTQRNQFSLRFRIARLGVFWYTFGVICFTAEISFDAARLWTRYRKSLYSLWLRRALVLQRAGLLQDAWLQMAAVAYYGRGRNHVSLGREVARHAANIFWFGWKESLARRRQWCNVSGLAQVEHPFFAQGNNPDT